MPDPEPTTLSLGRYAPDAKAWVVRAQTLADERGHPEIAPLHLLASGVEGHPGVVEVLRRAGANLVELGASVERALTVLPRGSGPAYLSTRLLDLLSRAERDADRERASDVAVSHVLNALSQEIRGAAGEILSAFGIGPGSLKPHLPVLALSRAVPGSAPSFAAAPGGSGGEARDLVQAAREKESDPVVGRDGEIRRLVTILERREKGNPLLVGEPGTGKRAIVRALAKRIAQGDVPTRLAGIRLLEVDAAALASGARLKSDAEARVQKLVEHGRGGANGKGRTLEPIVFVRGLDQLFSPGASGSAVGEALRSALSRGAFRLLGTTTPEGLRRLSDKDPGFVRQLTVLEVEEPTTEQAVEILRAVAARFEEHHGVRIGESAVVAAVSFAKRYLPDRFLPDGAVGLLDEAAAALRVETDGVPRATDRAFGRLDSIRVQLASLDGVDDAPTRVTRTRLEEEARTLEPQVSDMKQRLEVRRGAVAAARMLAEELRAARDALETARAKKDAGRAGELEHVTLPDLDKRLAAAELAARNAGGAATQAVLAEEHVAATVGEWTGIPVAKMLEGEADKLTRMEERLERRVVGQSEGVRALARAVRRGRVGLRDPRKPIGSFLFLGPSGVGKTELAKALAEFLFDDEAALTRLDMSEFMERHMAQRLLGAPPGYADSDQGGFLTEAVRKRPYSVLLFDEVEKAHEDVFNLLLQVLDDGRLTDGRGRLADFTNTVVILTSNIGSDRILETDPRLFASAEGRDALRDVLLEQLGKFFRPEFLNRIDDVIVFRPLSKEDLSHIVDIQLDRVRALLGPRQVQLQVEDAAKARLVDLGYEPALGARPLRRAILKYVQDPLAEKLLEKSLPDGGTLKLRLDGEAFVFDAVPSP